MEAIILAGGFGTRLSTVVKDVPKPMAPVCGKPFLEYVLDAVIAEGVHKVILAVGYKMQTITEHFGSSYHGVDILYSVEETPLYTGGAIKQALQLCDEDRVFAINGDTFFPVKLKKMREASENYKVPVVIAVKRMLNFSRYGNVSIDENNIVTAFNEKQFCRDGFINGGVYDLSRTVLEDCPTVFSIENDYFPALVKGRKICAFQDDGRFIDIGIPEDYKLAQKLLAGV
ncbi:nucleotidyltransferase family protein [uncultured Mailhella sp.]|uniref:nucleotidyltransferase family protein n=1 Tax=uncultured Mailhella sp. TaxID=1981031 RepID=UPI002637EE27|nr:nucleotidyltransferase family protein [uncultured Mailhella sp.]